MLTFSSENWASFSKDAISIFPIHWEELALDREKIPIGMDLGKYADLERNGVLNVVAVRDDGKLIGYHMALIVTHPHYKDAGLMATTDMFYILPEHRKAGVGAKLIMAAESSLRERGVVKAFIGTKLHQSHEKLLEALGWKPTDMVFSKLL